MIGEYPALGRHIEEVTQAQRVGCIPAHAHQHHLDRIVQPLEHLAERLVHQPLSRRASNPGASAGFLRQNWSELGTTVTVLGDGAMLFPMFAPSATKCSTNWMRRCAESPERFESAAGTLARTTQSTPLPSE